MDPQNSQIPPAPPVPPQPPMPPAPAEASRPNPQPLESHPALQQAAPTNPAFQPLAHDTVEPTPPKENKPKAAKKGKGKFIVWLVFVIIFGALCFAPLTPGLVVPSLPGNSDSLDTGAATQVNCGITEDPATTEDEVAYQNKKGLPLSYNYSEVVTTSYTCDTQRGKEFLGSTSVVITNWVAVAVDAVVALVLASIATMIVSRLRKHA